MELIEMLGAFAALLGGKELLSYLVKSTREQRKVDTQADHDREASVIKALVDMAQQQSTAQINLTQEAISTLKTMVDNVARQAVAQEATRYDSENWFKYFKIGVKKAQESIDALQSSVDECNNRIKVLVHTLASGENGG